MFYDSNFILKQITTPVFFLITSNNSSWNIKIYFKVFCIGILSILSSRTSLWQCRRKPSVTLKRNFCSLSAIWWKRKSESRSRWLQLWEKKLEGVFHDQLIQVFIFFSIFFYVIQDMGNHDSPKLPNFWALSNIYPFNIPPNLLASKIWMHIGIVKDVI